MNNDGTAPITHSHSSSQGITAAVSNHERIPPQMRELPAVQERIRDASGMWAKPPGQNRREFLQSSLGVPTAFAAMTFGNIFHVAPAEANNGGTIAITYPRNGAQLQYGSGYLTVRWETSGTRDKGYWLRLGTSDTVFDVYNGHVGPNMSMDIEEHKLPYGCNLYAQVSKIFDMGTGTTVEEMLSDKVVWRCPDAT